MLIHSPSVAVLKTFKSYYISELFSTEGIVIAVMPQGKDSACSPEFSPILIT
jgi:hypothetical protein